MTKKTNTLLFIIGATVFNILIFLAVFTVFFVLYIFVIAPYMLGDDGLSGFITPVMLFIFVLAIVLSFLIYRVSLNYFFKKVDIETHFDPLFAKRNGAKNKTTAQQIVRDTK
jgi:hypothetical protein